MYCNFDFRSGSTWLKVTPVGIRRMLNWVKYTYGEFPIYITENGVSDRNGSLQDDHRISYYRQYINNVLKGVFLTCTYDKVNDFKKISKWLFFL